jgi:methylenetetrahydrofolate--tRNA-(uracil-5-)-methyltransferase
VTIIGGGLAGSEAAWQAVRHGVDVLLYEMRPHVMTPVHKTGGLAELVCSNSLGSSDPLKAPGILKEELKLLGSLVMEGAAASRVPAGQALAVDRERFSVYIEEKIRECPSISLIRQEVKEIPLDGVTIIATGPMTSPALFQSVKNLLGSAFLYFYDAVSPIVSTESLDMEKIFKGSRYGKGDAEYLNCPLDKDHYEIFWQELINAERVKDEEWEEKFFEGCLPVEEIASRGPQTLCFGPMKPVGLVDKNGIQPYAVLQLRQENTEATMYNLVGFQTRLKWDEQRRVFRMIPGLERAEFLRLGVMHRNVFINSPAALARTGQLTMHRNIFMAGQITGVEGYVESAAQGALCGINAALLSLGLETRAWPDSTALGALTRYIHEARQDNFQPMNINFGLFPPLDERIKKRSERNSRLRERALAELRKFMHDMEGPAIVRLP